MQLSEFDYELPPERIAQQPLPERDASRMLWLHRATGLCEDRWFRDLPDLLRAGDLVVANESRVIPARLLGARTSGGGRVELLLLRETSPGVWDTLARPGRKLGVGERLRFGPDRQAPDLEAEVLERGERGARRIRFECRGEFHDVLERLGHVPLPPYIHRPARANDRVADDRERYQTVYAAGAHDSATGGSAAAPTAGLHFTPEILDRLRARGVEWATVRLHVGLGTFQSVESSTIEDHPMHSERYEVGVAAAEALARARRERRRIVAVGTTAARVLESIAPGFEPGAGETNLFLYPGGRPFQVVGAMLTNFHAPRTTLLMMISALAGTEAVRRAYRHALEAGYRFLSYGDCMWIG